MPLIKWSKKALKVSRKKQVRNKHFKDIYSDARKNFEKAIKAGDKDAATLVWFNKKEGGKNVKSWLQSIIDKLVKKNIIKANNWARKKAKYARMLKEISQ